MEGSLELLAEAWVDNGVNAAVEVAEPEGYFKDGFRRLTGREDGAWKIHTNRPTKYEWNQTLLHHEHHQVVKLSN